MTRVLILGAGGHAQVVADILLRARDTGQRVVPIGYLDDDTSLHERVFLDLPVMGSIDAVGHISHDAIIVAIGNNQTRRRLVENYCLTGETFISACHPTAIIAPDVQIGSGVMICAGAIINTGSVIGSYVILNTGCTVDHHNIIGNYVHVAPGVHTGGEVVVADGALSGIGATVAPRMSIGAWATIGAGAVVTKPVASGVTVVGVPARPLQKG
jgi:sugar O-acyltransferase (sialic acid O-acetyltransferase NeuD family)